MYWIIGIYLVGFAIVYVKLRAEDKKYELDTWEDWRWTVFISLFNWIFLIMGGIVSLLNYIQPRLPKFPKYPPKWL